MSISVEYGLWCIGVSDSYFCILTLGEYGSDVEIYSSEMYILYIVYIQQLLWYYGDVTWDVVGWFPKLKHRRDKVTRDTGSDIMVNHPHLISGANIITFQENSPIIEPIAYSYGKWQWCRWLTLIYCLFKQTHGDLSSLQRTSPLAVWVVTRVPAPGPHGPWPMVLKEFPKSPSFVGKYTSTMVS